MKPPPPPPPLSPRSFSQEFLYKVEETNVAMGKSGTSEKFFDALDVSFAVRDDLSETTGGEHAQESSLREK